MFIDSHAHLYMTVTEKGISLDQIIAEMKENGVFAVTDICGTIEEFDFSMSIKNKFENAGIKLFTAAGIHPHESARFIDSDTGWIAENADSIIAVGEVGLDFHYDFSPRDIQEKTLRKMAALSIEIKKPLIIHGRSAEERVLEILDESGYNSRKVLFHCYTGTPQTALKIIDRGYFISYSGILTFKKNSDIAESFELTPADRMLFETDSPFLAPVPFRGSVNTPAKVKNVYENGCLRINAGIVQFACDIKNNFNTFFGQDI